MSDTIKHGETLRLSDLLARQSQVCGPRRCEQSVVLELGAGSAPAVSTFLKAGSSVTGINVISDDDGPQQAAGHSLLGAHASLVHEFSQRRLELDYIDVERVVEEFRSSKARYAHPWGVLYLNHFEDAYRTAVDLAAGGVEVPLLLVLRGPGGVIVERQLPADAAARLKCLCGHDPIPPGETAELDLLAAGAVLGEVMLSRTETAASACGLVLAYSLHRSKRIDLPPAASWSEYVGEIGRPAERARFSGKRLVQIGAGGLAHPADTAVSRDGGLERLVIWDGDDVSPTNLNRQFLFTWQDIEKRKADVLPAALRRLDRFGRYEGMARFVREPGDLEPLEADALLVLPDGDEVRLLGADAARTHSIPMGTAATTATSGYAAVQQPGRACLHCVLGGNATGNRDQRDSCVSVEDDQIVATNMVLGALAVSELRAALSGQAAVNLRYQGTGSGNRLMRMVSDPPCPHR
jgi:molybdopterin/thiamine biosynthesis adenylyltransferase